MRHYGIDISADQGNITQWKTVYNHLLQMGEGGRPFCWVNLSDANQFRESQLNLSAAAGFATGGYGYINPFTPIAEQAAHDIAVTPHGWPIACDYEQAANSSNPDWAGISAQINEYCQAVKDSGRRAVQYDNLSWDEALHILEWPRWLAAPSFSADSPLPLGCMIQQLSTVIIPGVPAPVDLNVWRGQGYPSDPSFEELFAPAVTAPTKSPVKPPKQGASIMFVTKATDGPKEYVVGLPANDSAPPWAVYIPTPADRKSWEALGAKPQAPTNVAFTSNQLEVLAAVE